MHTSHVVVITDCQASFATMVFALTGCLGLPPMPAPDGCTLASLASPAPVKARARVSSAIPPEVLAGVRYAVSVANEGTVLFRSPRAGTYAVITYDAIVLNLSPVTLNAEPQNAAPKLTLQALPGCPAGLALRQVTPAQGSYFVSFGPHAPATVSFMIVAPRAP